MSGLPWFKLWPAEFLCDVMGWSLAERGAFVTLLAMEWREGSIPADLDKLARALGVDGSAMAELWRTVGDSFEPVSDRPDRLISPRLEQEREEAEALVQKKREAGEKGAKSRWGQKKRAHSTANANALANDGDKPSPGQPSPGQCHVQPSPGRGRVRVRVARPEALTPFVARLGKLLGREVGFGSDEAQRVVLDQLETRGVDATLGLCCDYLQLRDAARDTRPIESLDWFKGWFLRESPVTAEGRVA